MNNINAFAEGLIAELEKVTCDAADWSPHAQVLNLYRAIAIIRAHQAACKPGSDDCREAFDDWIDDMASKDHIIKLASNHCWRAWQAAWAARSAPVNEPRMNSPRKCNGDSQSCLCLKSKLPDKPVIDDEDELLYSEMAQEKRAARSTPLNGDVELLARAMAKHEMGYEEFYDCYGGLARLAIDVQAPLRQQLEQSQAALRTLVELKDHKDKCGATLWYETERSKAWGAAREALTAKP